MAKETCTVPQVVRDAFPRGEIPDVICRGFCSSPNAFKLKNEQLQNVEAVAIASAFCRLEEHQLLELILNGIKMSGPGVKLIVENLPFLGSSLTLLDLDDSLLLAEHVKVITSNLTAFPKLERLFLNKNSIGSDGGSHLAEALKSNESVKELQLNENVMYDTGAEAFAEALKRNNTLAKLCLARNYLTCMGAVELSHGLRENCTIQFLDLSGNAIGTAGAIAIAEVLPRCASLIYLDLTSNQICEYAQDAFKEALQRTPRVTDVKLDDNMTDLDSMFLTGACSTNIGRPILDEVVHDPTKRPRQLPLTYINRCTNYFSMQIGKGGYGTVFLGTDGAFQFAVKKQRPTKMASENSDRLSTCTKREIEVRTRSVSKLPHVATF
jgi:Ran GTPase-activating protein (RanGAP) involved in mRNA processing and transport